MPVGSKRCLRRPIPKTYGDRFRVEGEAIEGGMGRVYRAKDLKTGICRAPSRPTVRASAWASEIGRRSAETVAGGS
jgi:hypothetical protein